MCNKCFIFALKCVSKTLFLRQTISQNLKFTIMKIYVGTYKKYNEGSLFGKWLDLNDYADADDFLAACAELHSDEEDPEYMFQDCEDVPDSLYSESMDEDNITDLYEFLEISNKLADYDDSEWVSLHNQYCDNMQYFDSYIYDFTEDFIKSQFSNAYDAFQAGNFGEINWSHDYIYINGSGYYISIPSYALSEHIDKEAIIKDIIEDARYYNI